MQGLHVIVFCVQDEEECVACKEMLPRSAFSTSRAFNHGHCKVCNKKRLAEVGLRREPIVPPGLPEYECRVCYGHFNPRRMNKVGRLAWLTCNSCGRAYKQHLKHHHTIEPGCQFCIDNFHH